MHTLLCFIYLFREAINPKMFPRHYLLAKCFSSSGRASQKNNTASFSARAKVIWIFKRSKSQRLIPKSMIFLHMVFLKHKLPLQLKKCLRPAVKLLILLDWACSQERFFFSYWKCYFSLVQCGCKYHQCPLEHVKCSFFQRYQRQSLDYKEWFEPAE